MYTTAENQLIGESNSFLTVLEQASSLAIIQKPVLVLGERGTGKELIAHRLHYLSPWWDGPFISLNCSSLNENLLDSELFGHEAGAFTGAQKQHKGRFERADGGTLFLDELTTASMLIQEKLLRVIEYGELERVGGHQPLKVNVRLVCATNEDLPALVAAKKFRADLLDRLAFEVISLPPLRQRRSDIILLANHFAVQMSRELGYPLFLGFTKHAEQVLLDYSWPGNIRELKNVIERSVFRHGSANSLLDNIVINPFSTATTIQLYNTPEQSEVVTLPSLPMNLKQWLGEQEQRLIKQALEQTQYNQHKAANLLGLTYHQLRGILRRIKE